MASIFQPLQSAAASVLRLLEYDATYPVAPSKLLLNLIHWKNANLTSVFTRHKCSCCSCCIAGKQDSKTCATVKCMCPANLIQSDTETYNEASSFLLGMRVFFALALLTVFIVRVVVNNDTHGLWDADMVPNSYSLSLFFYFTLNIIVTMQAIFDPTHLLKTSAITHLTLWTLHAFTMTVVTASTASFLVYPTFESDPTEFGVDIVVVTYGVCVELLMSAWRIHGGLVIVTGVWSVMIAASVVAYKMYAIPGMAVEIHEIVESAVLGLKLLTASFILVWTFGVIRDVVFPPACTAAHCSCKKSEDIAANGIGSELNLDKETKTRLLLDV